LGFGTPQTGVRRIAKLLLMANRHVSDEENGRHQRFFSGLLAELQTRAGVTPARSGAFGLYHFAILLPD
jgi:hypothetical protein